MRRLSRQLCAVLRVLRSCALARLHNGVSRTSSRTYWFWVSSGEPVLVASLGTLEGPASFAPATSPEMFSGSIEGMSMIL